MAGVMALTDLIFRQEFVIWDRKKWCVRETPFRHESFHPIMSPDKTVIKLSNLG